MGLIAMILFPLLWGLWILYAVFRPLDCGLLKLLAFWLCIDLFMLFFFGIFWYADENWRAAEGINGVLLIMVYPLMMPLTHYLPPRITGMFTQAALQVNHYTGDTASVWLSFSLAMLPQTLLILIFSQIVYSIRKGGSKKHLLSTPKKVH